MTSTRPYLVRAFYEWIVDNGCTPYVVVDAYYPGVHVPNEYIEAGQIVLNISMTAVSALQLGDHSISCQARFGGEYFDLNLPMPSLIAIYAKENGRGMVFSDDEDEIGEGEGEGGTGNKRPRFKGKPNLTVVK